MHLLGVYDMVGAELNTMRTGTMHLLAFCHTYRICGAPENVNTKVKSIK